MTAGLRFDLPDNNAFRITGQSGSRAIAPGSGPFGFDQSARAYVFEVQPRTRNKCVFRGKIRIDEESFAVQRIEGAPAQSPSFWVKRTHFIHEYARFKDFWFPVRHYSEADLRLFGHSILEISYFDLEIPF